eukprot:17579-Heterococcus_DN1.PRE.3
MGAVDDVNDKPLPLPPAVLGYVSCDTVCVRAVDRHIKHLLRGLCVTAVAYLFSDHSKSTDRYSAKTATQCYVCMHAQYRMTKQCARRSIKTEAQ